MVRPVHFEIRAVDVLRAQRFYASTFGWRFETLERLDQCVVVKTDDPDGEKTPGINGTIVLRRGRRPAANQPINGWVCIIDVPSVDHIILRAERAGGELSVPKVPIKGVGWLAYLKDTEGNVFGVMENDPSAGLDRAR